MLGELVSLIFEFGTEISLEREFIYKFYYLAENLTSVGLKSDLGQFSIFYLGNEPLECLSQITTESFPYLIRNQPK